MKKRIMLFRFTPGDKSRIGLKYGYDPEVNALVSKVPGALYSGNEKCFHLPDRPDITGFLRRHLGDGFEFELSPIDLPMEESGFGPPRFIPNTVRVIEEGHKAKLTNTPADREANASGIKATPATPVSPPQPSSTTNTPATNMPPAVQHPTATPPTPTQDIPKTSASPAAPTSSNTNTSATNRPPAHTHPAAKPPTPTHGTPNTSAINIPPATQHPSAPPLPDTAQLEKNFTSRRCRVEMSIIPGSDKMKIKFFGYWDKAWIDEMRQYGRVDYIKELKEWRLKWSRTAMDSLSDYFSASGLEVSLRRNVPPKSLKTTRDDVAGEVRQRTLSEAALEAIGRLENHLREKRQSDRTIITYKSMLQVFFKYFDNRDPASITNSDVKQFMADFVLPLGYSASYQNQMISAIKTYYSLTSIRINTEDIQRPKRGRPLPKVFSKDEIRRILNATVNIKHRLILWMIYSCGLRRSEVLNIKITDLDRDRSLLHIRQGKGNVDRIVPMSDKVWEKIDEYLEGYKPHLYLFEGQYGGRYSAASVYNLFRRALWRAGIKKEVGVHALRHSYATHLHENGLDIRFIQELLGHRSSRTTEIYTHVSRRNLMAIKSPIDDIDIK